MLPDCARFHTTLLGAAGATRPAGEEAPERVGYLLTDPVSDVAVIAYALRCAASTRVNA